MGFVWIRSYFRLKINISMTLGSFVLCFLKMWMLGVAISMTIAFLHYSIFTLGGGGGTPYNGLYGEALTERGTFFQA